MSRVCDVTGKKPSTGNNRSKSMRATKRRFLPNLFNKKIKDPQTGLVYSIKVSAKGLKTLKKKGIL